MGNKFEGCTTIIYDINGTLLATAVVLMYDAGESTIEIVRSPELSNGMRCELLIMSEPVPYAYSGVVRTNAARISNVVITMFKGQAKEQRGEKRYKLTGTAEVLNYIDDKKYDLHKPIKVSLINVSARGVRFQSSKGTMSTNDKFDLRIRIGKNYRILKTKAVNNRENDENGTAEYGCLFIGDTDE